MENIKIRTATLSDAVGIARVHVLSWQHAYKGQMPQEYLDNLSIERRIKNWTDHLSNQQPNSAVFVAEVADEIVGFCGVGINRDDDVDKSSIGELYTIYLDPKYMGKGIGSQLMQAGLGYLRNAGFKQATLWVLTTNEKTIGFYKKQGWRVEGKIKIDPASERRPFELHETRFIINL